MEKVAFKAGAVKISEEENSDSIKSSQKTKSNKLKISIAVLIAGLVTLAIGIVFLVITLTQSPKVQDAEYLISAGSWQREDNPGVIWDFTDVGKGTLTTDGHSHDYDFIWAIDDGNLKIETEWLYTLNDEYSYTINDGKLVLNDSIVFVPIMSE